MKIRSLRLVNYRQFHGEHEITFSTDPKKPITLILGDMGFGKSNLMNAICWAFWGDEPHLSIKGRTIERAEGFANTLALEQAGLGVSVDVEVEVRLEDHEGNECIVLRRAKASLREDGSAEKSEPPAQMFYDLGGTHATIDPAEVPERISQIIPRDLRHLFLFNGETIHSDVLEAQDLTKAVEYISQVEVIDRAVKHIRNLMIKEKPHDMDEQEIIQIAKDLETQTAILEGAAKEEMEATAVLAELNQKFEEQQAILAGLDTEAIESLRKRLQAAKLEQGRAATESKQARDALHREVVLSGGLAMIASECNDVLAYIESNRADGDMPPPIEAPYIRQLLKTKKCICGVALEEGSKHRGHVEAILKEFDLPEFKRELDGAEPSIRRMVKSSPREAITSKLDAFEKAKRAVKNNEDDRERLEAELKKFPEERVKNVGLEIQRIRTEESKLLRRQTGARRTIQEARNKLAGLSKQDEAAKRKQARGRRAVNRLDIFNDVSGKLQQLREAHLADVRVRLSSSLNENWNALTLKDTQERIEVDSNYHPAILDARGRDLTRSKSKGELQTLGYAYTSALTKVSRVSAPFIVDTPLGRISNAPGANIAKQLPLILPDRQLVFLATDREYNAETKTAWKELIGKSFELAHKEKRTEVMPYEA